MVAGSGVVSVVRQRFVEIGWQNADDGSGCRENKRRWRGGRESSGWHSDQRTDCREVVGSTVDGTGSSQKEIGAGSQI